MKRTWIHLLLILVVTAITACVNHVDYGTMNLEIHDLQGCSHVSPYSGKTVHNISGVVTHKISNGFIMQSIHEDFLSCTSEAIFVFTEAYPDVMRGDLVEVTGTVAEFVAGEVEDYNLSKTEMTNPKIRVIEKEVVFPEPIILDEQDDLIPREIIDDDSMNIFDPDHDGLDYFESLEFMLVQINNGKVIAPKNNYNEIVILPGSFVESNLISETGALLATNQDRNPEKIMVKLPEYYQQDVHVGEELVGGLTGVMDYSFGNYKMLCFNTPDFLQNTSEDREIPKNTTGITFSTYNLENLSPFDSNSRYEIFAGQIVNLLNSPDILVLQEVMDSSGRIDDGTVDANKTIEKLLSNIIEEGGPVYSYSDPTLKNNQDGGMEGANIRSVLLYRKDSGISVAEPFRGLSDWSFSDDKMITGENPIMIGESEPAFSGTRKAPLWLLEQGGNQFVLIGIHLVSQNLNSSEWGSTQPPKTPETPKRISQTKIIQEVIAKIFNENPKMPVLVVGDLNDMPWSESSKIFSELGLVNAGTFDRENEQFSYIFEGNAQQLDYVFLNQDQKENINVAMFLHVNTILDKSRQNSDHDPFFLAVDLFSE